MLVFSTLSGQIQAKPLVPLGDVYSGVEEGEAEVFGASFLHMGIGGCQLPGLVGRWRHACIGKDLVRIVKAVEIANLGQDHGSHPVVDAGNRHDRRAALIHNLSNGSFYFFDVGSQGIDLADRLLEFYGSYRHL